MIGIRTLTVICAGITALVLLPAAGAQAQTDNPIKLCASDDTTPEHPATLWLLFDNDERYVATGAEHEAGAREQIAENGSEVSRVVDIDQPADDTNDEEVPA